MTTTPLDTMRKQAASYAAARDKLAALVQAMKDEISTVERGAMLDILRAARKIAALHNDLAADIAAHPECFARPRTIVVDGLKFGLQKQRGKMSWDSDEQLIRRADTLLAKGVIEADEYDLVVQSVPRVSATGLARLDAAKLKRLGVTVNADTDAPLVKSVDGDVEKLVGAIVRQATQDAEVLA